MRALAYVLFVVLLFVGRGASALETPALFVPDAGIDATATAALDASVGIVAEGANAPSPAIYPPQQIALRFNHALHVTKGKATCVECHPGAVTSDSVSDRLLPSALRCDQCHGADHADLAAVKPGRDPDGQCSFCHTSDMANRANTFAVTLPRANLVFTHKRHAARNIGCGQCHGAVQGGGMATRSDLPKMQVCSRCHQAADSASREVAKAECATCHVPGDGDETGHMKTKFATGTLLPPAWLGNAEHTPDFIERHKWVAGNDSALCKSCHTEESCTECHDGRVRPRSVHPNDFLAMHPIEARRAMERCTSCHNEQSFCLSCHQRLGITMTGPSDVHGGTRFHPPKSTWSDPPMTPAHHGFEAERNIEACVSCHVERDCVVCHGGSGRGGGFNPHPSNFFAGCGRELRRNPRPCMVCHTPGDGALAQCR